MLIVAGKLEHNAMQLEFPLNWEYLHLTGQDQRTKKLFICMIVGKVNQVRVATR
jgi:hypothetical protein